MENKELAIEFTETNYLTRSMIVDYFGYTFKEELWFEVCKYRRNFAQVLPLQCVDNSNVFVVQYANLNKKLEILSREVIQLMRQYNSVNFNRDFFYNHKNYFVKNIFEEMLGLLKVLGFDISINTLILLVNGKKRPVGKEERFSKNLFMIFYRLVFSKEAKTIVNLNKLEKIAKQLGNNKGFFRTERWYLDINNTVEAGFDPENIKIKFNQLLAFIHSPKRNINPLIKATAVFYYFKLGIFTTLNLDLIAIYLFLYTLKTSSLPQLVFVIPLIKSIIKKEEKIDAAYINCASSNNDITYLVNEFIDIILKGIKEVMKEFAENKKLTKEFTSTSGGKPIVELKTTSYDRSIQEIQSLGLHNKEQLFLQVAIRNNKKQTYTLEDFQAITNASYEKSRYSMNHFVRKNFFSKSKKGKKFIYTIMRENIMREFNS